MEFQILSRIYGIEKDLRDWEKSPALTSSIKKNSRDAAVFQIQIDDGLIFCTDAKEKARIKAQVAVLIF